MKRWEIYIYVLLIIILNASLAWGTATESMIFSSQEVWTGQWWRIITHPFVHVSWYHLLLDGAAFFILYIQLAERSLLKRTLYVAGCGFSSLLAASVVLPQMNSVGYCGLSGIAHGLMAVCALELIAGDSANKSAKYSGIACLAVLVGKSLIEALSGRMIFSFFHTDMIGAPIGLAHLGGVAGGCLMFLLLHRNIFSSGYKKNKSECLQLGIEQL